LESASAFAKTRDLTMPPTHNTLSENIPAPYLERLSKHLAAAIARHAQVKEVHWDPRGPGSIAIHDLFDKAAAKVENYSDPISESAGGPGGTAHGASSRGGALVPRRRSSRHRRRASARIPVSGTLAAFGQSVREAIGQATTFGDADTANLFTEISRGVDQQLWFVESHIAPKWVKSLLRRSRLKTTVTVRSAMGQRAFPIGVPHWPVRAALRRSSRSHRNPGAQRSEVNR
jgi:starvation-inducible DNA-binding protein